MKLADKWRTSISTYLGMMIHGFPNMLMPAGPQSGSASTNYPRGIETGVNWCAHVMPLNTMPATHRLPAR